MLVDGPAPAPALLARIDRDTPLPGVPLALCRTAGGRIAAAFAARGPAAGGVIRVHSLTVAEDGTVEGGAAVQEVALGEAAPPVWASLAISGAGTYILWRTEDGSLYYRSPSVPASRVATRFQVHPQPALLVASGKAFVAGARADGVFTIEQLK